MNKISCKEACVHEQAKRIVNVSCTRYVFEDRYLQNGVIEKNVVLGVSYDFVMKKHFSEKNVVLGVGYDLVMKKLLYREEQFEDNIDDRSRCNYLRGVEVDKYVRHAYNSTRIYL